MKLMLVGKAGRGKTTLLKKISDKGQRGIQENLFLSRMSPEAKQFQKDLSTGNLCTRYMYSMYIIMLLLLLDNVICMLYIQRYPNTSSVLSRIFCQRS